MKKLFFLWILTLFIYLFFAGRGKFDFPTTARNYFSLQAYSILKGHLDLIVLPKNLDDLSVYNGKIYLYWPPVPSFFVMPFVLLFGTNVSDAYYTAFWGSFATAIMYLLLNQAKKARIIPQIKESDILLLSLFFSFGTVFFYLSVTGSVWFTSQVISAITQLISLYFLFKFLNDESLKSFLLSLLFLSLAFWSRTLLIFSIFLHIYYIFKNKTKK